MSRTAKIDARRSAAGHAVLERVLQQFAALAPDLPRTVPDARRRAAAEQLARLGWPNWREESWRYANVRALERIERFAPARLEPGSAADVQLPAPVAGFERIVYVDGLRGDAAIAAAVANVMPLAEAAAGASGAAATADQRLGLLCDLFAPDTAALHLSGERAIELVFVTTEAAAGAAVYPRLQLTLAAGARVQLLERHLGAPSAPTLVCCAGQIALEPGARLVHHRLQQYGEQVLHFDSLAVRAAADAQYGMRHIALGAATSRTSALIALAGSGATLSWQGLAAGRGEQVHDTALQVEHTAPATRSEQVFRGIADGRARLAFAGHVRIDAAARAAEARQSLRGLLEGAAAEIDLRPRLEIHTDEVKAQHGATSGRLDENLMFYLLSRGLDRDSARALLKWAFLSDVLRAIELPAVRAEAERAAAGRLRDALAPEALAPGALA